MGEETMALPLSEKMEHEQGDGGVSFGYKALGANAVDERGNVDGSEYINVAQDDILAWPKVIHRTYPRTVNDRMENTLIPFVRKSKEINTVLLRVLEKKLGLPEGEFVKRHLEEETSGSETRCIKSAPVGPDGEGRFLAPHTDFGSVVSAVSLTLITDLMVPSHSFTIGLVVSRSCLLDRTHGNMSRYVAQTGRVQ